MYDISHTFLPLTVAKLSTLKNDPGFLAHPVYNQEISNEESTFNGAKVQSIDTKICNKYSRRMLLLLTQ